MKTVFFYLCIFLCLGESAWAQTQRRNVEVTSKAGETTATLSSAEVVLKRGDSVKTKLEQSGIVPNSDALSIVYDFNPYISDANSVKPGQKIVLPVIEGIKKGQTVSLVVNPKLKANLDERANLLKRVSETSQDLQIRSVSKQYVQAVGMLRTAPASQEALRQMELEGQLLTAYSDKTTLTKQDRLKIGLIQDYILLQRSAAGSQEADPLVEVNTLEKGSDKAVHGYTILYVPVDLYKIEDNVPFPTPSPSEMRIAPANYFFWAVKPGESEPVTERKLVEVRFSKTPIHVGLTVLK